MAGSGPSKPIPKEATQLTAFVQEHADNHLRSVVWYDRGDFEILYGRDDVLSQYTASEIEDVVDELALESREKAIKEKLYPHGNLDCTVQCYETGIEMHFVLDNGEGVVVALDPKAFVTNDTFLGNCLETAHSSG